LLLPPIIHLGARMRLGNNSMAPAKSPMRLLLVLVLVLVHCMLVPCYRPLHPLPPVMKSKVESTFRVHPCAAALRFRVTTELLQLFYQRRTSGATRRSSAATAPRRRSTYSLMVPSTLILFLSFVAFVLELPILLAPGAQCDVPGR